MIVVRRFSGIFVKWAFYFCRMGGSVGTSPATGIGDLVLGSMAKSVDLHAGSDVVPGCAREAQRGARVHPAKRNDLGEDIANQDIEQWLATRLAEMPEDVRLWLNGILGAEEYIAAFFYADVLPEGGFGERWNVLTNERYLVVEVEADKSGCRIAFEVPLDEIQGARVRTYIGSGSLVLTCQDRAHEVARFGLGSQHEAADLCYYVKEVVKGREEGKNFVDVQPPITQRPRNR